MMWSCSLLLCLLEICLLFICVVNCTTGPPRLLGSKQETYTANVGDTVKLKCRATGANDALAMRTLFYWKKLDSKRVIRSSKDFPRFKIKQGKYLKIKNVQLEDGGKYLCSATNQFGLVTAYRILKVKDTGKGNVTTTKSTQPTKAPFFTLPMPNMMKGDEGPPYFQNGGANNTKTRKVEHPIGHVARLKCAVGGKPVPSIAWTKDGIPITKDKHFRLGRSNSVLVFKALRKEDSGNYSCIASNSHGSIQMRFLLKVESFARFRDPAATRIRNVTGIVGKNLTLSCRTDMRGRRGGLPRLHWIKWNSNLKAPKQFPAPRERTTSPRSAKLRERSKWDYSSNGNGSLIGKLTLINVTHLDQGRYSCMAGTGRRWSTIEEVNVVIVHHRVPVPSGAAKKGISFEVPILILVLVPTLAGLLCIVAAFCCWQFNKKKRRKKYPESIPLREKPLQNGSGCHDKENSKFLDHSQTLDRDEDSCMPNGTTLHITSDMTGEDPSDLKVKTNLRSSFKVYKNTPKISGSECNGQSLAIVESKKNCSTDSQDDSVENKAHRTCCSPVLKTQCKTPPDNAGDGRLHGKVCPSKTSRVCVKANGFKLGVCKCQSTDIVDIKTNSIFSSNAETRTL